MDDFFGVPWGIVILAVMLPIVAGLIFALVYSGPRVIKRVIEARRERQWQAQEAAELKKRRRALRALIKDALESLRDKQNADVANRLLQIPDGNGRTQWNRLVAEAEACELPSPEMENVYELYECARGILECSELTVLYDNYVRLERQPVERYKAYGEFIKALDSSISSSVQQLEQERGLDLSQEVTDETHLALARQAYQACLPINSHVKLLLVDDLCREHEELQRPAGWSELIARHVDLKSLNTALLGLAPAESLLHLTCAATSALDTNNPLLAMQVLAQANEGTSQFVALGGTGSDLIRLVERWRANPW